MISPHYLFLIIFTLLTVIIVLVFKLWHYFHISETDELTYIPNYRSFRRKIRNTIAANKRNRKPLSVAIIDIDHFRRFNDHSYTFGDIVLKEFAGLIQDELPAGAFIARFRFGDEFIIILNMTEEDASTWIKKTFYKSSGISRFNHEFNTGYTLTFSYGIAGFDPVKDTEDTLVKRAEKALKDNKIITET